MACQWTQNLRQGLWPHFRRSASATGQRCQANLSACRHQYPLQSFVLLCNTRFSCHCSVFVPRPSMYMCVLAMGHPLAYREKILIVVASTLVASAVLEWLPDTGAV